jgi:hypothetical protein
MTCELDPDIATSFMAHTDVRRRATHEVRPTATTKLIGIPCSIPRGIVFSVTAATLTGLLGDEDRLRIVAAIALGARTIDDVAKAGGLAPHDVRRALPRLFAAGVVEDRDGLRVDLAPFRDAARDRPPRRRELPDATPEQARVLRNFVENGRLKALPVRASHRRLVLEYLAARFDEGIDYAEADVNDLLVQFNDDYASLRRSLIDERLLTRSGGVYRRL